MNKVYKVNNKQAMTLAEVLITLGIIGVVCAFVLPTLIKNYQKNQAIERLKTAYSDISQAIKASEVDNGPISTWEMIDSSDFIHSHFINYFKGYKEYPFSPITTAGYSAYPKDIQGNTTFTSWTYHMRFNNGSCYHLLPYYRGSPLSMYGYFIWVDTNGTSAPNIVGKDLFVMVFSAKGVYMYGEKDFEGLIESECLSAGQMCGAKIHKAGWKMADNYPWQ